MANILLHTTFSKRYLRSDVIQVVMNEDGSGPAQARSDVIQVVMNEDGSGPDSSALLWSHYLFHYPAFDGFVQNQFNK